MLEMTSNQMKLSDVEPSFFLHGINPLVSAAFPLLSLLQKIKETAYCQHVFELQKKMIEEIQAFEAQAKKLQCSPRLVLAARYCLCTALDEAVMLMPWGHESLWQQQSLLSVIHQETWGGERFFIILEKMTEQARENLSLLELLYLILSLGYEGKYYNHDKAIREEIRHRLYRIISIYREVPQRQLTPGTKKVFSPSEKNPCFRIRHIVQGTLATLLVCFVVSNIMTWVFGHNTLTKLDAIAATTPRFGLLASKQAGPVPEHHHHRYHKKDGL